MALIKVGKTGNYFFSEFNPTGNTIEINGLSAPNAIAPIAEFTVSATAVTEGNTISFTNQSLNNPTGYSWTFITTNTVTYVNGTKSNSQNPQVQFIGTDNVDVELEVTNSVGSDTETKVDYISVSAGGSPPIASFTTSNNSPITGATITLLNTTFGGATGYSWTITGGTYTLENGTTLTDTSPQISLDELITYGVTLEASNHYGTDTAFDTITSATGQTAPIASFTIDNDTPQINETVTFTDTSSNGPNGWNWSITGIGYNYVSGTTSTSQNPKIEFTNGGNTYYIKLTAFNDAGSDESVVDSITTDAIIDAPVASFTISDSTPDTGQTVTFTDTSTNTPTSWSWSISGGTYSFVSGTTSSSQNPYIEFNEADTEYSIELTAVNVGGSGTTSNNISTNPLIAAPVASFTISDSTPDTGQTVTFTDTSTNTPTSWSWSISGGAFAYVGGTSSTSQNPQVSFSATSTNYTVNLTATNAGGSNSTVFSNNITTNIAQTSKLFEIDFVNTSSYVGSGSTLNDLSPEGNSMTLNSGYSFSSDNPKSMTFSTGYAEVTSTTTDFEFQTNESFGVFVTFEVPPTSDGVATLISNMLSGSPYGGWDILLSPSTELIYFQFIDSWTSDAMEVQWSYDFDSNAGKFIQIGVVFDGSSPTNAAGNLASVDLYIDGALYTTGKSDGGYTLSNSSITYNSSVELRLSSRWASGASSIGFNRAITHAVIYNGIPSVTEIENQYDDIKTRFKPNASFTISNSTPDTGATVTFTDTSTSPKGSITNYSWSISGGAFAYVGGTSSTSQNPQVSFSATSTNYTVNLTATNANGSDSTSFSDNITTNAAIGGNGTDIVSGYTMYYDFGNTSCYNGGTSVTDLGTAGADSTIVGSNYVHTSGDTGYFSVTGGTTYLEIPINATLQSVHTDTFTHYFVVKDVSVAGAILHNGNPTTLNDPSGTPEQYVWSLLNNNNGSLGSSIANEPDSSLKWVHICVTKSGGTFKWYIDGQLIETDTVTSFNYTTYSQKWLMWRRPRDTTSSYFTGKHSIFLVYNSVLSAGDIEQLYNHFSPRYD